MLRHSNALFSTGDMQKLSQLALSQYHDKGGRGGGGGGGGG